MSFTVLVLCLWIEVESLPLEPCYSTHSAQFLGDDWGWGVGVWDSVMSQTAAFQKLSPKYYLLHVKLSLRFPEGCWKIIKNLSFCCVKYFDV